MTATSDASQSPSATLRDMSYALRAIVAVGIVPFGVHLWPPLAYGPTGPLP